MTRLRQKTMRICLGFHIDFLSDLIKQLDKGAKLNKVLAEWKRDCGAVNDVDSLFERKQRGKGRS